MFSRRCVREKSCLPSNLKFCIVSPAAPCVFAAPPLVLTGWDPTALFLCNTVWLNSSCITCSHTRNHKNRSKPAHSYMYLSVRDFYDQVNTWNLQTFKLTHYIISCNVRSVWIHDPWSSVWKTKQFLKSELSKISINLN